MIALATLALSACEGSSTRVTGPAGASAFQNFVVVGTGLSMGVQSGGILYSSQNQTWAAILAQAEGASFRMPLLRAPGCQPPFIAPLRLGVYLSGLSSTGIDSSCAGPTDTLTPPVNNLAIAGASAWAALNLTPKLVASSIAPVYSVGDRARYPLVLSFTQSQITAMRIERPTFVAVELGLTEVLGAATSGLLVAATSYTQTAPYTYVPATVFAPMFAAVTDSVKLTGARVVVLSVPRVAGIYGLYPAAELWSERTALATYGISVNVNCSTSATSVFVGTLVPFLAAKFISTGVAQPLSCADVPGVADAVLTPADLTALDGVVTQMNVQIQQIAQTNGWAFADLTRVFPPDVSGRTVYSAADQLSCVNPFGYGMSLDGTYPNAEGHRSIATAVSGAIKAKYGFATSLDDPQPQIFLRSKPCP